MAALKNKIDFVALISVTNANGNGDPLNGNRPRTDYNGMGDGCDQGDQGERDLCTDCVRKVDGCTELRTGFRIQEQ